MVSVGGNGGRSTTSAKTEKSGWIGFDFGADIHGAQKMSPADFADALTFRIVPP